MTVEPFSFVHSSRRVLFAWDGLDKLKDIAVEHGARRAAIVLDGFFLDHPLRERVVALLTPVLVHRRP